MLRKKRKKNRGERERERKEMKGAAQWWWNIFLSHSLSVSWAENVILLFAI